jgi:hypothetical protein
MEFNPFAWENRNEWLPFFMFYLILIPLALKFYRSQKKKNILWSYEVSDGKWVIYLEDGSPAKIEVKDGKWELDGREYEIEVKINEKKSTFKWRDETIKYCDKTRESEIVWKTTPNGNVNKEMTWKRDEKTNSDYYLTYIPKWVVSETLVAILTPFVTYLVMNWGLYFALSGAIRWSFNFN